MELLQLKYFVEVARRESFTQAARALHVSQPALSQTVKRLEREVGAKLFEREGNRIHLTARGRRLYSAASHALLELQAACGERKDAALQGNIMIGAYTPVRPILPCIEAFAAQNPDVTYTFLYLPNSGEAGGKGLDALLYYDISDNLSFNEHIFLGRTGGSFVLPAGSSAAAQASVSLTDLEESAFVSLIRDNGWVEEVFQNYAHGGSVPNLRYRTNSALIKQEILEAGLAAGVTNSLLLERLKPTGKYSVVPHPGGIPRLAVYWGWWDAGYLSPAARALKEFSCRWFDDPEHRIGGAARDIRSKEKT